MNASSAMPTRRNNTTRLELPFNLRLLLDDRRLYRVRVARTRAEDEHDSRSDHEPEHGEYDDPSEQAHPVVRNGELSRALRVAPVGPDYLGAGAVERHAYRQCRPLLQGQAQRKRLTS